MIGRAGAILSMALALSLAQAWAQQQLQQNEEPLASAIAARLEITRRGQGLARAPEVREPVMLHLTLTDRVTGLPARIGAAQAVIRAVGDSAEPCRDMTHRLRALGMATSGDYPLNGSLFLTITADREAGGHYAALVDPLLADSRNTLAIRSLAIRAPRLVGDAATGLFAVQDGTGGAILRLDLPDLAAVPVAAEPGTFLHLDTAGLVLVSPGQMSRLRHDGSLHRHILPEGAWVLERSGTAEAGAAQFAGADPSRRLVLPRTRAERYHAFDLPPAARAAGATADGALAAYAEGSRLLLVNTASGAITPVAVGRPPRAVHFTGDGRFAFAVLDDGITVAIIDAAAGRLMQAITLEQPLAHLALAQASGFIQLADATLLRFALAGLSRGEALALAQVSQAIPGLHGQRAPSLPPLAVMAQGEGVLAAGFRADRIVRVEAAGHGGYNAPAPPATPIRGGIVSAVSAVARGFTEAGQGRYLAPFAARAAGPHVLVLADRLGKISACAAFEIGSRDARAARPKLLRLRVDASASRLVTGRETELILAGETPLPADAPETVNFEIMAMTSPWRVRVAGQRQAESYRIATRFPHAGQFVARPLAGPPFEGVVVIRLAGQEAAGAPGPIETGSAQ